MKLARFSRNPTSPLDRTNGINLNYTHARTYEQLLSRLVRAVSFEDRHSARMPIKNGPLVDGAWQIRGGHQTTINAFFGNYSAGETGPGVSARVGSLI